MEGAELIGWKLYYCDAQGNRSTFSSKNGSWAEAPRENVQYLFTYWERDGKKWKTKLGGCDVYVLDNDQAARVAEASPDIVKLGKEIDSDTLLEVMREAVEDPEVF
jgi:hypothetical protein